MEPAAILAWIGALSPIILLGLGAYFKRALDRATVAKTRAEAQERLAAAGKTRAESESIVLANTKALIEQAKAQQLERDAMSSEKLAVAQVQIKGLTGRVGRMEEHFTRLRAALATHGVWDSAALVDLREIKPEYPEPPDIPMDPAPRDHFEDYIDDDDAADTAYGAAARRDLRRGRHRPDEHY